MSNSQTSMILKNSNTNICKTFDYVNFAKLSALSISGVGTAHATKRYTMQFWIFAYEYVSGNFPGVTFTWNYHNQILIKNTSGTYTFQCYPIYNNGAGTTTNSLTFVINTWNYVSCAVDLGNGIYYMNQLTSLVTNNYQVNFAATVNSNLSLTTTTLSISETATANAEWGVLFYSQIRLWQESYTSAGFLSRVNIQTSSLFSNLLNLWDPKFPYLTANPNAMKDIAGTTGVTTITTTGTIGTNVIDDTVYSVLTLASEDGQYFDPTTSVSVNFLDITQMNDFSFGSTATSYIPVSYSGNYTMDLWFFSESISDVTNGINFIWDGHLGVSVIYTTQLQAYCFPQGYYDNINGLKNSGITGLTTKAGNVWSSNLTTFDGVWSYVRCAVSNYNKQYYVNQDTIQTMNAEILFDTTYNDYPYRYYFPSGKTSIMYVQNGSTHTKKIYIKEY